MAHRVALNARQASGGLPAEAAMTAGASIAATCVGAVASIMIARSLGPVGRGEWAIISSLAILIGTVGTLGLPAAGAYAIARARAADRPRMAGAALTLATVMGIAAFAAYAVVGIGARPGTGSRGLLLLGAVIAGALLVHAVAQKLLLTASTVRWFALAQLVPNCVMLTAVAGLAAGGHLTLTATVTASAVATTVGALMAALVLRARAASWVRPSRAWASMRPYLRYALLSFGVTSLTQIVQRVDILIVGGYLGSQPAGLYAVAAQVGDVLLVVPAALGFVIFRRGALDVQSHWPDALRMIAITGAFGLLAAGTVALLAAPLVRAVFGAEYLGAVDALRLLMIGIAALGIQAVVSAYVAARGRPRAVFAAWATAALVNIGLNLIVVPDHGIEGAAVVSSLSYLLVLGLHVRPLLAVRA
jgi:O-antigen/teichoic acid export membrane protein